MSLIQKSHGGCRGMRVCMCVVRRNPSSDCVAAWESRAAAHRFPVIPRGLISSFSQIGWRIVWLEFASTGSRFKLPIWWFYIYSASSLLSICYSRLVICLVCCCIGERDHGQVFASIVIAEQVWLSIIFSEYYTQVLLVLSVHHRNFQDTSRSLSGREISRSLSYSTVKNRSFGASTGGWSVSSPSLNLLQLAVANWSHFRLRQRPTSSQ